MLDVFSGNDILYVAGITALPRPHFNDAAATHTTVEHGGLCWPHRHFMDTLPFSLGARNSVYGRNY